MADASLIFNILGRDKVSDLLARVKREAATANDDNVKGFKALDAQIEKTRATVAKLAADFARTGTDDAKRDFQRTNRQLKGLERLRAELGNVAEDGAKAGGALSKVFESISGSVGKNPYLAAGIASAIVVGAPIIGAAVSAAVLLGVGGGVLAGGIALAVRDARVKAAYAEVGRAALDELSGAAGVFVEPMIRGAKRLRDDFDAIMPSIRGSFSTLAPVVERLIAGVGGLVRNAMPGVADAVRAAAPLLDALAGEMPRIGAAVSVFLREIASGGPGAVQFLRDFLRFIEGAIVATGFLIGNLSKLYDFLRNNQIGKALTDLVPGGPLLNAWDEFGGKGKKAGDDLKGSLDGAAVAAGGVVAPLEGAATAAGHLEGSFRNAIQQVGFFTKTLDQVNGGNIALASSQITAQGAIRQFKDALQESHGSLDISTEKGAAARQAAIGLAQAAGDVAQKTYEQTGSSSQASVVLGQYRQALINTMVQSGMTSEAAGALADEYLRIPTSISTPVSAPGLPQTKADAAELYRGLDRLDGKQVNTYVVTHYSSEGIPLAGPGRAQAGFAKGGTPPSGEPFWVGEKGPELMFTRTSGTYVMPHGESMQYAAAGAGGMAAPRGRTSGGVVDNRTVTYVINDAADPNRVVAAIKRYEKDNGKGWRDR